MATYYELINTLTPHKRAPFQSSGENEYTLEGTASLQVAPYSLPVGLGDQCLRLPGGNGYADLGDFTLDTSAGFTLCGWFAVEQYQNFQRFFGIGNGEGLDVINLVERSSHQSFGMEFYNGDGYWQNYVRQTSVFNLGQWYFLCAVFKPNLIELWVNGAKVASKTLTRTANNVTRTNCWVGRGQWHQYDSDGDFWAAGCAILEQAVDATQIAALIAAANTPLPDPPALAYVDVSLQWDDAPAQRNVFAVTWNPEPVTGSDDGQGGEIVQHQVVGHGRTDAQGNLKLYVEKDGDGYKGLVRIDAQDDYGTIFEPEKAYAIGDVIHPTDGGFIGYVYECVTAGTSGTGEPTWWAANNQPVGSAVFKARPYFRPLSHGPVKPTEEGPQP